MRLRGSSRRSGGAGLGLARCVGIGEAPTCAVKWRNQVRNPVREPFHCAPVCELHRSGWVCGAVGQPHDQSDHQPVHEAISWVVQPSGKHRELSWCPGRLLPEGSNIRVRLGSVFAGLASDDIDREERADLLIKCLAVGLDEAIDVGTVPSVADARPDNNQFKRREIEVVSLPISNSSTV